MPLVDQKKQRVASHTLSLSHTHAYTHTNAHMSEGQAKVNVWARFDELPELSWHLGSQSVELMIGRQW